MNSIQNAGIRFQMEQLSEDFDRLFIDVPHGTINIGQANACMAFLNQADLPKTLMMLNQMFFQAVDDPTFTLSQSDKESLEYLTLMLIRCWQAERNVPVT